MATRPFHIRFQIRVEVGSYEENLLEYITSEHPDGLFTKNQMLMIALKPYWTTLALLSKKQPPEQLIASLNDAKYLWELHERFLRERIGVESDTPIHQELADIQNHSHSCLPDNDAQQLDPTTEQLFFNPFGENVVSNF